MSFILGLFPIESFYNIWVFDCNKLSQWQRFCCEILSFGSVQKMKPFLGCYIENFPWWWPSIMWNPIYMMGGILFIYIQIVINLHITESKPHTVAINCLNHLELDKLNIKVPRGGFWVVFFVTLQNALSSVLLSLLLLFPSVLLWSSVYHHYHFLFLLLSLKPSSARTLYNSPSPSVRPLSSSSPSPQRAAHLQAITSEWLALTLGLSNSGTPAPTTSSLPLQFPAILWSVRLCHLPFSCLLHAGPLSSPHSLHLHSSAQRGSLHSHHLPKVLHVPRSQPISSTLPHLRLIHSFAHLTHIWLKPQV